MDKKSSINKRENILGKIGSVLSVIMYVAYIPQIIENMNGQKENFLQPLAACINCCIWVGYGFAKEKKDWPLIIANAPGIIFGLIAFLTAVI